MIHALHFKSSRSLHRPCNKKQAIPFTSEETDCSMATCQLSNHQSRNEEPRPNGVRATAAVERHKMYDLQKQGPQNIHRATILRRYSRVRERYPVVHKDVLGRHQVHYLGIDPLDDHQLIRAGHHHVPTLRCRHPLSLPERIRSIHSGTVASQSPHGENIARSERP